MAVTRVYSTLLFVVAGLAAIVLGFSPKFGAFTLGGIGTATFGAILLYQLFRDEAEPGKLGSEL
jgi:putative pyrimidine permease RutG